MEILSEAQIKKIKEPLPKEAVKQHPTKTYLSSIKAIYVTERLNDVFGIGKWTIRTQSIEKGEGGMVVVKVIFEVPTYGIYYESFGGNDNGGEESKNFDLGDAYKGATTDAITKIASYIGIGIDVFKGLQKGDTTTQPPKTEDTREWLNDKDFDKKIVDWCSAFTTKQQFIDYAYEVKQTYRLSKVMQEKLKSWFEDAISDFA